MEPLTNKPTDQELIEKCYAIFLEGNFSSEEFELFSKLLTRFKSLTENRSELVEKCVEAILYASHKVQEGEQAVKEETEKGTEYFVVDDTELFIMESKLRTALTTVLNPEKK